ncbi:MAG: DUF4255 domain-containing protein [Thermoanaerobaculia bacterium]|nr:DUF4255 domain-containing protein [Thermoanaerobaculia bacterium]
MGEIRKTLELVRKRLNEYVSNATRRAEDWVLLTNPTDAEGRPYEATTNRVVMVLANLKRENLISTYQPAVPIAGDRFAVVPPPLYIDLYLLFWANFTEKNYPEGLELIAYTITFFQQNPVFTHETLPGLDPSIDKLTFEFTNLDLTELNYLLGLFGAKYLPSVYYKVRLIPFVSDAIQRETSAVQGVHAPGELEDLPAPPAFGARSEAGP